MWGIDEGAEGPPLYRHLVAELDKLGLAYVHVLHTGNEQLVGDIRARWKQVLIVNRPGRPRDQIGTDVGSGWPIWKPTARWSLPTPILSRG
jgi:N-ethylmaleimide reductase